jgi:hypothetical protein
LFSRRFPNDSRSALVHVFAGVFLSHVEIELNLEPSLAFRWRSALGFHEWQLSAAAGTFRRDGMRIFGIE